MDIDPYGEAMHASPTELVVVFRPEATPQSRVTVENQMRAGRLDGIELKPLSSPAVLAAKRLERLGESTAERLNRTEKSRFYTGTARGRSVDSVLDELRSLPGVETAYWKPGVENPLAPPSPMHVPQIGVPGATPSDFRTQQGYLDAAPGGINAPMAWARSGGAGAGVRIVDIEGGWQLTHTDLLANSGGLVAGTQYPELYWRDHGTSVLGELGGDANGAGVTGICPDAILSCVSHGGLGSSRAIEIASGKLRAGDILLLEMHRPGPRFNFANRTDQRGYVAVEWWPDDLLAIQGAVAKGIVVIEAAGNGAEDFDDVLYDTPHQGFPTTWRNPLRGAVDSGAIIVGAGAPPSGAYGPDRSRLDFSNWGTRVDCQAWGRQVVSTGYGDFYADVEDPHNEDYWYTRGFSGTSSASPIVAGAAACLQGVAKAAGRVLHPLELRAALRDTGSPQAPSPGAPIQQRIGARPDLAALMKLLTL